MLAEAGARREAGVYAYSEIRIVGQSYAVLCAADECAKRAFLDEQANKLFSFFILQKWRSRISSAGEIWVTWILG
jgi:hypothetical protein